MTLDYTEISDFDRIEKYRIKLKEFETLEENWDGDGAKAVDKTAVKNCQSLLGKLSDEVLSADFKVFPSELGAISIKLKTVKGILRSEIGDTIFSYYIRKSESQETEYHSFEEWNDTNVLGFIASLSSLV